jgi:enoyl reductase-like protein
MSQLINEAKRMQFLAGIITESQINELNEPEKELVDAILGEGINEGKFNPKEILAKLIAVAKKGLLTATVLSTVLASCNFGPSVDETIKNRVEQYKVIDSMELAQKERDEAFKNKIDSLKQDLKAIEYQSGLSNPENPF